MILPHTHRILFAMALLLGFYEYVPAETQPFPIVPTTVSPVAKAFLRTATPFMVSAETLAQWKEVRSEFRDQLQEYSHAAKVKFVRETETRDIAGVPVLIATPKSYRKKNDKRIVIYIHGGAYTLGRPAELYHVFAPMASATGMKVFAIDYRLAPDHPFPAGLNDSFSVYKALLNEFEPENIVIFGDSAGAGMVLATLLKARDAGLAMPAAVVLYSPWVDISKTGDTYYTLEGIAPTLHYEKNLRSSAEAYVGKTPMNHPLVSPVYGDYAKGFPPTLIQVGTRDLLLSNCARQYRNMKADGVDVELSLWEGMWHVFEAHPDLPEAQQAVQEAAAYFEAYLNN